VPLYDFICAEGHRFERLVPLADFEADQFCPCGAPATRVITPPRINRDYPGYSCPVTGRWIEGRKAHRENLKETGCRILEPGERESFIRRKEAENAAFDASIEATVERLVENLPSHKKERLANELSSGIDISVERK
jgi:putative FmdB family regulatory protein